MRWVLKAKSFQRSSRTGFQQPNWHGYISLNGIADYCKEVETL